MSATSQRDKACRLARSDPKKALLEARKIDDPWYRAQALLWVARFTHGDPVAAASEAARAARECDDDYKKSAVRAWEIAALAERGCTSAAGKSLTEALSIARSRNLVSSRSEATLLLLEAASRIGGDEVAGVYEILRKSCPVDEHWRCKRAVQYGAKIVSGELRPRSLFW